ncbi:MAG: amidohydrolase [Halolamina sp.]
MTDAADLVLTNAEVHALTDPDETAEAVAVRDGRIVRVGNSYDVEFLAGAETRVVDCEGRVVLPGFVDAHTHLETAGKYLVHADLSAADTLDDAVSALQARAAEVDDDEPVLGFGYDESTWPGGRYLDRDDLDAVAADRPVVAFREDMHVASVNGAALERFADDLPAGDVRREDGAPTGVLVEDAVGVVRDAFEPGVAGTRDLVVAAIDRANAKGVTAVHDMVRRSQAPRVYRELDLADELTLRVRLNYWSDHLDALVETGLRTNHGSEMVQVGAVKSFTDGSFGGRTAKLSEPYADAPEETGQWVVDPAELREIVARADKAGLQLTVHAIGDEAVRETVDAFADCERPGEARHRVEHVELADDDLLDRMADLGVVASMQPNFLKWAQEDGLYESRLGERRTESNRFAAVREAGVPLAFSSDCMPLDPLLGVHHAVNAPTPDQRLDVTDALRAYTRGAAYAGHDEDRMGTVEPGTLADLVVLDDSPWDRPEAIRDIDVATTVVGGDVVHDQR